MFIFRNTSFLVNTRSIWTLLYEMYISTIFCISYR